MFYCGDDDFLDDEPLPPKSQLPPQKNDDQDENDHFEDVAAELDLGEPPEELKEYARKHLGENPETRPGILQEFRDMIYERGEVVPNRTDDLFLMRFLRARRFDVEKAHRLLTNYYKFKKDNPEIHNDVKPLSMRFIGDDDVLTVPPYREQNGRRMMIYRIGNWNPSSYTIEEIFKATVIVLELAVLEQRAQILGGICIIDLEGISLQHAWHVTPTIARMVIELLVTSFPIRTHAIHILNESWVFDIIFAIFRPLLDERMREKIYFHGHDLESLHTHIDPKFLPKRYGGMRPDYSYTDWMDNLFDNKDIVSQMEKLGYDFDIEEAKRVLEDAKSDMKNNKLNSNTKTFIKSANS